MSADPAAIKSRKPRRLARWPVSYCVGAVDAGEVGRLTDAQIEAEIRILIGVLDGLELQWLLDASIDLPGLLATYLDTAITRWQGMVP